MASHERKHVSRACQCCREAKAKCNGEQPCERCVFRNKDCSYPIGQDRRTGQSRRQVIDHLEQENQHLRLLLEQSQNIRQTFTGQYGSHAGVVSSTAAQNAPNNQMNIIRSDTSTLAHPPQSSFATDLLFLQDQRANKLQQPLPHANHPHEQYTGHSGRQASEAPYLSPGSIRSFGNLPFSSAVKANHYPATEQDVQLRNVQLPAWSILPQWEVDDTPLGKAYTDFHQLTQRNPDYHKARQPLELVEVTLLFRARRESDVYNADNWASELQAALSGIFSRTVNLAGTYCLACLMRWLLNPTPATYAAIPRILKPTLRQRMTSHPASIDVIPFPTLRNSLLQDMKDGLLLVSQAGMDLDWPHTVNEALLHVEPKDEIDDDNVRIFIAPRFAEYVDDPKHWILGRKILDDFPELLEEVTISDQNVVTAVDEWL